MRPRSLMFVAALFAALPAAAVAQLPTAPAPVAQAGAPAAASSATIAAVAPRQIQIGDSVRIPIVVNDAPVGAKVELRMEGAPAGARLVDGALRWRPTRADANATYRAAVHAAVDGAELARTTLELTAADAHRAPIVRQPTDRVIPPGDSLTQAIEAWDPDGDVLSYAVTNVTDPSLPPRFDRQTTTLSWQAPRGSASRVYVWRVTVSDGEGGTTSTEFNVAVRSQNVAPACAPMRSYRRDEGDTAQIALDAEDANGDSLAYQPLATLPNGVVDGSSYRWNIPYGFVPAGRPDSTVRFEWRATDPSGAATSSPCVALITVTRSIAEGPFRARQAQHRQLIADVRAQLLLLSAREHTTRDSVVSATRLKRTVKRASLVSALVGGLLQIASSEETRRISAAISATFTVGLGGWESTIDDGGPISTRAESIAQERTSLAKALTRFLRRYGETVSREALLGPTYDSDYGDLFDVVASATKASGD